MTARELIEVLKTMGPETPVYVWDVGLETPPILADIKTFRNEGESGTLSDGFICIEPIDWAE